MKDENAHMRTHSACIVAIHVLSVAATDRLVLVPFPGVTCAHTNTLYQGTLGFGVHVLNDTKVSVVM